MNRPHLGRFRELSYTSENLIEVKSTHHTGPTNSILMLNTLHGIDSNRVPLGEKETLKRTGLPKFPIP